MENFPKNKRLILVTVLLALVSLVMLGSALKDISFRPAQPIGGGSSQAPVELPPIAAILEKAADIPFWQQVVFWVVLFLLLLLVTSLLNPELRKQLILGFIRTAIFFLGLFYILKQNPGILSGLLAGLSISQNLALLPQASDIPAPEFQPPQVSGLFSYVVAFGVVLLAVLFFGWLNRFLRGFREAAPTHNPLEKIAAIARSSLQELEAGHNSQDAIIQCYERMSAVVSSKHGLRREHATTPSEFAARLERSGLPREAVSRLTHLFEAIRYGGYEAGPRETTEAISCLTSILKYCGEAAA